MSGPRWVYPDMNKALYGPTVELCNQICERFGYDEVKRWQGLAIQALLHGTDVVASSGTGSGKSLVFQGLTLSRRNAIVLVISPLISIMEDQVRKMTNLNISAEAITKRTKKENRHVWEEVERGKYRIVYASPEVILSKRGYFFESLVRNHNKFMEDLVAVAVDEAHLIWDWVGFRDKYQLLGTLRNILNNVPWVLLSATLSPMVAAYVHEVCNLRPRTMRFIMSCRRDNINLAVCPIKSHDDLNPLLDLIRPETRDFLSIPKTIIFHDGIEGGQRIADALRARLPSELSAARDPHETIQMFFGSIDEKTKKKTLSDLESGKCRIVICTDAFGLGVDISNIERVIQWGVDEKISISSLTQRIGRAARNPFWIGQAIIYVHKAILEAVSSDWEAGWEPKESSEWVDVGSDDDDSPRVIPISKMRRLERFGIPVTEETRSKVSLFIRNIYTEAKSVKEANRIARREIKGTTKAKLTAAQKVDPAVLWVLCTVGCRHRAILSIYKDEMAFDLAHRSWCCDRCAKALTDQSQVHSDTLKSQLRKDAELLDSTAAFLRTDPTSCKIILISNRHIVTQNAERFEIPRLPVCKERRVLLKSRLYAVRYKWWKLLNLPSFTTPQMILPDDVIEHLIQSVRRIHCQYSLERELQAARFDVASSLMPSNLVPILYQLIDKVLCSSAHLETGMEPNHQPHAGPRQGRSQQGADVQGSPQRRVVHIVRSPRKGGISPRKAATTHKRHLSCPATSPSKPGPQNKRHRKYDQ